MSANEELAENKKGSGQSLITSERESTLQSVDSDCKESKVRLFLRKCFKLLKRNLALFLVVVFAVAFLVYRKGHKLREFQKYLADFISSKAKTVQKR